MGMFIVKYSKAKVVFSVVVSADYREEAEKYIYEAVGDVTFISSTTNLPKGTVAIISETLQ